MTSKNKMVTLDLSESRGRDGKYWTLSIKYGKSKKGSQVYSDSLPEALVDLTSRLESLSAIGYEINLTERTSAIVVSNLK